LALSAALAVVLCTPGMAQDPEARLSEAAALIRQNQTDQAISRINDVLHKAGTDFKTAARATLLRAEAQAQAGKPVFALADFEAALWFGGLDAPERKRATDGRSAMLARLGMGGDPSATVSSGPLAPVPQDATPRTTAAPAPTAPAPTAPASTAPASTAPRTTTAAPAAPPPAPPRTAEWTTSVQDESPQESSGLFGSLFGIFSSRSQEPESAATSAESWSTGTTLTSLPAEAAARSSDTGRSFRVQIASVATEEGARAEASRLGRRLADALGGATPEIVRMDTEAGNTYYRIIVGPQPTREQAQQLCETFKSQGVDCLVVSSR
jgi:hypothetical protein